jgi:hypothetical protein
VSENALTVHEQGRRIFWGWYLFNLIPLYIKEV